MPTYNCSKRMNLVRESHDNQINLVTSNLLDSITFFGSVTKLGGVKNMSCKVLELYLTNACHQIESTGETSETLSLLLLKWTG